MLIYSNTLVATCDEISNKKKCWKESVVEMNDGERLKDAKLFLKNLGWDLYADNYNVCPYCSKGIGK